MTLAISLHAPDDDVRTELVPVARRFPLDTLMEASRHYQQQARRRVTYEYTLLDGVNDGLTQAADLARLLRGQRCHVNLIPFNPYPDARFRPTPRDGIRAFRDALRERGLRATVRRTRGRDISGACGQLHAGALLWRLVASDDWMLAGWEVMDSVCAAAGCVAGRLGLSSGATSGTVAEGAVSHWAGCRVPQTRTGVRGRAA